MAVSQKKPTGFEKYRKKYPDATEEDYKNAVQELSKKRSFVGPPRIITGPDGTVIPISSISPSEIGSITRDFLKSTANQQ